MATGPMNSPKLWVLCAICMRSSQQHRPTFQHPALVRLNVLQNNSNNNDNNRRRKGEDMLGVVLVVSAGEWERGGEIDMTKIHRIHVWGCQRINKRDYFKNDL